MTDKPQLPTRAELLDLLRAAPAKQGIADGRYWDWKTKVDEVLSRLPNG